MVERDPDLSPLDLIVAPNGNVIVSSEHPFGAPDAVSTLREYDSESGGSFAFSPPRSGQRFRSSAGYPSVRRAISTAALDEVVAFDCASGRCVGAVGISPVAWAGVDFLSQAAC